jgi:hypothetical protein
MRASLIKSVGESAAEAQFEAMRHTNAEIQGLDLQARANKLNVDLSKAKVDANWAEMRAGDSRHMIVPENLSVEALAGFAHNRNTMAQTLRDTSQESEIENLRKRSAERIQSKDLTQTLLKNEREIDGQNVLRYGGGIAGSEGESTVLSGAVSEFRSEYNSRIAEKQQLIKHFNLSSDQRLDLALGKDVSAEREDGLKYTFKNDDTYAREAAIDMQLKTGSFSEVQKIIMQSGVSVPNAAKGGALEHGSTYEYRTSISNFIKDYGLDKKAIFLGAQTINDIAQGNINGDKGLDMAAARAIHTGKISDDDVSSMKKDALDRLFNRVSIDDLRGTEAYRKLSTNAEKTKMEDEFRTNHTALKHSAWRVMHTAVLARNAEQEAKPILENFMAPPPPSP